MRLHTALHRADEVTLVAVRATNPAGRPRRVRIATRFDGPVWPPRVGGRPAPGWDDGGYEGVIDAHETRSLGFATTAPPPAAGDPVEVAWTEAAPEGPPDGAPTPGVLLDRLGDPRPPRDAVPDPGRSAPIPAPVRAWLDRIEARVRDGAPTPADRETLDRVAARVTHLRRTGRRHRDRDRVGGSP